jgi:DNA polymerase V
VVDDSFEDFEEENDLLIVDKSLVPQANQLAIVIQEDSFQIHRIRTQDSQRSLFGCDYVIKSVL